MDNRVITFGLPILVLAVGLTALSFISEGRTHGRFEIFTDRQSVILKLDRASGQTWMLIKAEGTNVPAAWVPVPDVNPR